MIFIDAGAFIAKYRAADAWHVACVRGWNELEQSSRRCFTSNLVVAEAVTLISRYCGHLFALDVARKILESSEITVLRSGTDDELEAVELLKKFADQPVGFVDGISFVLMRRRRIKTAFGFDRHFRLAGFRLWPEEM